MRQWPQWVQTAFWRKPIGDSETFKLALFFIGNGCEPSIVKKWIITSLEWEPSYTEKDERAKRGRDSWNLFMEMLDTRPGNGFILIFSTAKFCLWTVHNDLNVFFLKLFCLTVAIRN